MRLLNDIRMAGQRIFEAARKFDDKYSLAINRMYERTNNPAAWAMGAMIGGGHPSLRKGAMTAGDFGEYGEPHRQIAANMMNYALPAVAAVPKYVLPATGVTLAGKGIYDLATGNVGEKEEKDADRRPYG